MSDVGTTHGTNLFVKEGWEGKMSALASSFGLRGEYPPICELFLKQNEVWFPFEVHVLAR